MAIESTLLVCALCEKVMGYVVLDNASPELVECIDCNEANVELGVETIHINPEDLMGIPYTDDYIRNVFVGTKHSMEEALHYLATYDHLPDTPAETCAAEVIEANEASGSCLLDTVVVYKRAAELVDDREEAHRQALCVESCIDTLFKHPQPPVDNENFDGLQNALDELQRQVLKADEYYKEIKRDRLRARWNNA